MSFRGIRSRAAKLRREIGDKVLGETLPGLRIFVYDDPDYEDVAFDGDDLSCDYKMRSRPDFEPTEEGLIPHLNELPEGGINIAYWTTFDDVMEGESLVRNVPGLRDAETD